MGVSLRSCEMDVRVRGIPELIELRGCHLRAPRVVHTRKQNCLHFIEPFDLGGRSPHFHRAIERFKGPDYVYPGYGYAPWTELARLLASLAPLPLTTCFRATGGSEAVDLALQRTDRSGSARCPAVRGKARSMV